MESVFSFLPYIYYFSIILLANAKINKSASLFLSPTGSKWCWTIRPQDFKLNISKSIEQSNEIVYTFSHVDTQRGRKLRGIHQIKMAKLNLQTLKSIIYCSSY